MIERITLILKASMPGGTLQHLRAMRRMENDRGRIRDVMTFTEIARPSRLERLLIVLAQGVFYNLFFWFYVLSPRTAHRFVGHLGEEAIYSYTEDYWKLALGTLLRDVIVLIRADEAQHRDVNHQFADELTRAQVYSSGPNRKARHVNALYALDLFSNHLHQVDGILTGQFPRQGDRTALGFDAHFESLGHAVGENF